MPYIPHTHACVEAMLECIGESGVDALFDEIPESLQLDEIEGLPEGQDELTMLRELKALADLDVPLTCFAGAGSYDHHIPAAVWDIAGRGEFMTSYTPYQAEASQGTLQLLYEYQSMMCALTGQEVSNASVYDGATALAESVLMAIRASRRAKKAPRLDVLAAAGVHPHYLAATRTCVFGQGINVRSLDYAANGITGDDLPDDDPPIAFVVQQPNVFGRLEDVDRLAHWAKERDVMLIALVNPTSLALLKAPGAWGREGADIVCGDGQPFGVPMASGGPTHGFVTCRKSLVRQLPGRIVARTRDTKDRTGFVLTLQAREQHIRRAKATSNICTNQGLLVTASTLYLSLMGASGLREVAARCHENTARLAAALCEIPGIKRRFEGPFFHEAVIELPCSADEVSAVLARNAHIFAGIPLGHWYSELENCLLVCATEKRTEAECERYVEAMRSALTP